MRLELRTKEQYKTSQWSGGQTTELYLYPPDGDYARREFSIRLSSATVETETSTFTKLPGIDRKLMILEGELFLEHQGIRSREMKPYDVEAFQGDWDTISRGQVRDFNLMVHQGNPSTMECCRIAGETSLIWKDCGGHDDALVLLYVIQGDGVITCTETAGGHPQTISQPFHPSDLVLLHNYRQETCRVTPTAADSAHTPTGQQGQNEQQTQELLLAVCTCRELAHS